MTRLLTDDQINVSLEHLSFIIKGIYEHRNKWTTFKHICGFKSVDSFSNIVRRKPDYCCEECHDYKRVTRSIKMTENMKLSIKAAEELLNIKCLNIDEYQHSSDSLEWKCLDCNDIKYRNIGNILYKSIKCPKCSSGISEAICREILENLYPGYEFKSTRLNILKSAKDRNLELDCYSKELSLALEYQGIQHCKYVPFLHNDNPENFEEQKARDNLKIKLCSDHEIYLVHVDYTVKHHQLKQTIYDLTHDYVRKNFPDIEINEEYLKTSKVKIGGLQKNKATDHMNDILAALSEKNYTLLDDSIVVTNANDQKIGVVCDIGHHYFATKDTIVRGHGENSVDKNGKIRSKRYCPFCAVNRERWFVGNLNLNMQLNGIPIKIKSISWNVCHPNQSTLTFKCLCCDDIYTGHNFNYFDEIYHDDKVFCDCSEFVLNPPEKNSNDYTDVVEKINKYHTDMSYDSFKVLVDKKKGFQNKVVNVFHLYKDDECEKIKYQCMFCYESYETKLAIWKNLYTYHRYPRCCINKNCILYLTTETRNKKKLNLNQITQLDD